MEKFVGSSEAFAYAYGRLTPKAIAARLDRHPRWIVGILVALILSLEIILPNQYIMGYAYVIPILIANYRIKSRWGAWITAIAATLTLLFCFDRAHLQIETISLVVFSNRTLAALALLTSYYLSIQVRTYSELAANRQAEIIIQARMAAVRTDFAGNLVHDLQTPLIGAVETISGLMHGDFGAVTTEQERVLGIMTRSHRGSIHHLKTLLEVCHTDYHGLYLNYETTDLAKIATNAIDTLANLAKSRQVQIELVSQSTTTEIECDSDKIDRVFTNLVLNAITQSPPNSQVVVSISQASTQYLVRVIDRGRGINPDDLPRIFARFYHGEAGRRAKGAGLGLYLVRQIIERHGGTVIVEPQVEKGVTFLFTLPKTASEA
jgi:two-component system, NarL family, sensor kinase